jgi:hypothetical protein
LNDHTANALIPPTVREFVEPLDLTDLVVQELILAGQRQSPSPALPTHVEGRIYAVAYTDVFWPDGYPIVCTPADNPTHYRDLDGVWVTVTNTVTDNVTDKREGTK